MEIFKFAPADKVVTIRISEQEQNILNEIKMEFNTGRWHHKLTTSELCRKMIQYCINNDIKV